MDYNVVSGGTLNSVALTTASLRATAFNASTFGTGADGDITFSTNVDLTALPARTAGRTCEDAKVYAVSSIPSGDTVFLTANVTNNCLLVGDEVMLHAVQSVNTNGNVGKYEFFRVAKVIGNIIKLATSKANFYGEGNTDNNIGIGSFQHKVQLQRVPNYLNVTITSGMNIVIFVTFS